ncbi:UBX domain [Dillenia turbinata]|uniref:UBX domain n=1 Tax=Dillenia turbinata TaxID=194707 RepID=A0AAN8UXH6_9MAGN
MSSMWREASRAREEVNGFVRRMVNLPRSIIGSFSRAIGHTHGRRNQTLQPNFIAYPQEPTIIQEEWAFLASYEQQYGSIHPFFYACRFMEVLKMAEDDHKFVFLYLHSPDHPFTPAFCRETLGSELVVQFLDANFVCWGTLANRGEGLQMSATLRPASFPFCAVVASAPGNSLAVLQQMEGPISPAQLVEILQRTVEEQGPAFGISRAKEEERISADRRLREEQDTAYLASLQLDKEKERLKKLALEDRVPKHVEASNKAKNEKIRQNPTKESATIREKPQNKTTNNQDKSSQVTQILIRFPNGERREQGFLATDKIHSVYRYIDSLNFPGIGSYKLISSFPRRVYGADQMNVTLKDAGLHPKATLFLELV